MLSLASIEEICAAQRITLIMHPAIRSAVRPYGESFYVGACCFLRGETNGLYLLPLESGGYVRLRFSKRQSPGGHNILRVDPLTSEGLDQIKRASRQGDPS